MPFSWAADPGAEAGGVVLAVDVTRHARVVGFQTATVLSRGVWGRFIGRGPGQEQRLLDTLVSARTQMANPSRASDDGTVLTFALRTDHGVARVVTLVDPERESVTLMLWREFTHRPQDGSLRVRIVAEEEPRPAV